ncbi:extracellular solute-binding protein [Saccharopolyspora sp. K220]|uniref:ABC transporter substrate-binding protein n=1 Tax=Saccharopolyspora soli TaxID=2926618 RepID=UPI001F58DADD|nr:extracellular solute-binding protein [Saccharopolyspora soli]MCI2421008.1 extracellular solute-binding protein [Saccharopolyspora soli]
MRTRSFAMIAVTGVMALLAAACGGGVADTGQIAGGGTANSEADKVYAEIAAVPRDQQRAKAVELAKQEGSLSIYSSMTQDVADVVRDKFQQQFGIQVSVFRGNSETVLQRILQEGGANRLGADAVETNFAEMAVLAHEGMLADYTGTGLDKVKDTGKFDHWTASRFNVFLPAWNTNLIRPGEEPRSWEELADPKYRGKITLEVSDSDWYENVTKYWLDHGKSQQEVDNLWRGIVSNAKAAKGHTTMMELLGAGQTPMDAMNYTYITERARVDGAPVAYRLADGTNPIPAFARPNGVGMLRGAKNPAAAWLFYDWMLNEGQQVLVDLHLTPSTDVPGDNSFKGINLVPFDVEGLTKEGADWDRKYDEQLRGVEQVPN